MLCFKKLFLPPLLITARIARFNGEPQGGAFQSRGRVETSELELAHEAPKIWQWSRAFKLELVICRNLSLVGALCPRS